MTRVHGGANALGQARFDFSTNVNACGPCPAAWQAVRQADARHYPDTTYTALRQTLGDFHGVDSWRVVLAGSASEFIFRITAWVRQQGGASVGLPKHAYGDYADAARAWGLRRAVAGDTADLVWACEPSSPLGQAHSVWTCHAALVLDCAYAPLRLSGKPSLEATQLAKLDRLWQLYSPNKALGLTGVRAAYAIAPGGAGKSVAELDALAPSWVLGAHGVAMLLAWTQAPSQHWLAQTLPRLRAWKARQIALLEEAEWQCLPSEANFFCAKPPEGTTVSALCNHLRHHSIQLRDTTSFGLPGLVRLGVLEPRAQDALVQQLQLFNQHGK